MLKRELGLTERDIIDIPQLFKLHEEVSGILKAEAYFPNMVRMVVCGVGPPLPVALSQGPWAGIRGLGCLLGVRVAAGSSHGSSGHLTTALGARASHRSHSTDGAQRGQVSGASMHSW